MKKLGAIADLITLKTVGSTNDYALERDFKRAAVIVAKQQTGGKGRNGKSFVSPKKTGLYMSVVVFDAGQFDAGVFTAAAAVAVCRALKEVFKIEASIKWVNDIYYKEKKICGILCESRFDGEGKLLKTVAGIGVNLTPSASLPEIAGSAAEKCGRRDRNKLIFHITDEFLRLIKTRDFFEEYKNKCFILGRKVSVLSQTPYKAEAVGLKEDFSLLVKTADGGIKSLNCGEVSVIAQV